MFSMNHFSLIVTILQDVALFYDQMSGTLIVVTCDFNFYVIQPMSKNRIR